jgi:NADH:ubiquinone oxidoreductase subunit 2 (subunit N)
MLVAAISVEPFLYAALIIEMAVLLSIPFLTTPQHKPAKGIVRYLIFQTLAVPFILFSGWLLAGIGANPGNLALVQQAAILLGLGFSFLLAIFPFYTWIPLLAEESHPYIVGFLFWMLPTATLFFGLGFLDRYSWLRDAPALPAILTTIGALMIISGGILSAFQRHLGRIMGYATIVETGFSLLALSMGSRTGLGIFFLLLVPRTLSLCLWAFTLSILREHAPGLSLEDVKGMGRIWPFAASGLVLANLALAGLPLLAGFPAHQAIWEGLAHNSLPLALWVLVGSLGLLASATRVLGALTSTLEGTSWGTRETQAQRFLVAVGTLGLFLLGLFPQWVQPLWTKLPAIFEHLGQ